MVDEIVRATIETYDRIAPDYCRKTMIDWIREFEHGNLDKFLTYIGKKHPKVLDIGCGDGRDAEYLHSKGAKVTAIDLSSGMQAIAKSLVKHVHFVRMDMRELKFGDHSFDGLWTSGVIYHVPKSVLPQVVGEAHRVLKTNGVYSLNFKLGEGEGMESDPKSYGGHPRYFAYFSVEEMQGYLDKFELLEKAEYPEAIFGDRITHLWTRKI